jgi:hypothetical protein
MLTTDLLCSTLVDMIFIIAIPSRVKATVTGGAISNNLHISIDGFCDYCCLDGELLHVHFLQDCRQQSRHALLSV